MFSSLSALPGSGGHADALGMTSMFSTPRSKSCRGLIFCYLHCKSESVALSMTSIAIRVVFEFDQQVFDIDRKSMELNHALRDTFGTRLMKNSCF